MYIIGILIVSYVAGVATYVLMQRRIGRLMADLAFHDHYLDLVLRTYHLHLTDPYVYRPGFEEKRCYHCHYPLGEQHDRTCPWVAVQPLRNVLYP